MAHPGKITSSSQTNIHSHTNGKFWRDISPHMYVYGPWKEAGEENSQREHTQAQGENFSKKGPRPGIKPATFLPSCCEATVSQQPCFTVFNSFFLITRYPDNVYVAYAWHSRKCAINAFCIRFEFCDKCVFLKTKHFFLKC